MKVLLRAFNVEYEAIEDVLPQWKAKSMLKSQVAGDIAPHQMFKFYNDFDVKDTSQWGDLSYEEADVIQKTMATKQDGITTTISSQETPTPIQPVQPVPVPSTSRSKNGKRT